MKPYRIPQLAKPYTDYDMIQRHTELPPFSDGRGHLLYIYLGRSPGTGFQQSELFTLVTGLVQLGLDTHEGIDRYQDEPGGDIMRTRQLKVLAGDYFSSWFYHLLAKHGQVEMVGTLSEAIADYNVMKAKLYSRFSGGLIPAEQYLKHTVQLNMRLFLSFTPMIEESLRESWLKLLAEFSLCETAAQELRRAEAPASALEGYAYWKVLESATEEERQQLQGQTLELKDWKKLKLRCKCDSLLTDKLHTSLESIRDLLQDIRDEELAGELRAALDRLLMRMKISRQAAVEG